MVARCVVAWLAVAALCPAVGRADDDDKKKAELKWARGVADDLLAALKQKDEASAEALLTGEYAKVLTARDAFKSGAGQLLLNKMVGFDKVSIAVEEISPDRDEAQFKGELSDSSGGQAVVIRVVKEKDSGRWRVGFVLLGGYQPREKPKELKK